MNARDILTTDFLKINNEEDVGNLIGKFKTSHKKAAVVVDEKGNYLGITSKRYMRKTTADLSRVKIEHVMEKAPTLNPEETFEKIAYLMYVSDSRMLAVVDKGKLIGVVNAMDLINQIKDIPALKDLKAREVASTDLVTLDTVATVGRAIKIMREKHINRIPVIEGNELKGLVSFRNLLKSNLVLPVEKADFRAGGIEKMELSSTPITEVMISENIKKSEIDVPLRKIVSILNQPKGSQVLLMENNKPAGIITPRDLLESFLRLLQERRNIQYIGFPELDEIDKASVENLVTETYDKIEKIMNNVTYLTIHVKKHTHEQKGLRTKWTVNSRVSIPGMMINSKSWGWKFMDIIQESLDTLLRNAVEDSKRKRPNK